MTFQNGNTYKLNDPDLSYVITSTQFDKIPQNKNLTQSFLNDMKYDSNYGDKKSSRYNMIECLLQPQLGSGINKFISLPSDPDELVDQLKLLYFEEVGGNDNPMLSEQIVAITDKLLEYECITTNQHQKMRSTFGNASSFS